MKKQIKILVVLILLSIACVLTSCKIASQNGALENEEKEPTFGEFEKSMKSIDGSTVDFGNATRIRISNKMVNGEKKFYLTFLDNSDDIGDLVFSKGKEIFENKDIKGHINKLLLTDEYIFFSFTKNKVLFSERNKDANYDSINYLCNESGQSFIIDKATGNVYSLKELPKIDKVVGEVAVVDKKLYEIKIINNKVVFEQCLPNKMNVFDVFEDKFGQYFVFNDSVDGNLNGFKFINIKSQNNINLIYCLGENNFLNKENNLVYTVNKNNYEVIYYRENFARSSFANNQSTYTFHSVIGAYEKDISFLFRNEYIFRCESGSNIKVSKLKNADSYKDLRELNGQTFIMKNNIFNFKYGDISRADGAYYSDRNRELYFTKIYTEGESIKGCGDSFMVLEKGKYYKYLDNNWKNIEDEIFDTYIIYPIALNSPHAVG